MVITHKSGDAVNIYLRVFRTCCGQRSRHCHIDLGRQKRDRFLRIAREYLCALCVCHQMVFKQRRILQRFRPLPRLNTGNRIPHQRNRPKHIKTAHRAGRNMYPGPMLQGCALYFLIEIRVRKCADRQHNDAGSCTKSLDSHPFYRGNRGRLGYVIRFQRQKLVHIRARPASCFFRQSLRLLLITARDSHQLVLVQITVFPRVCNNSAQIPTTQDSKF